MRRADHRPPPAEKVHPLNAAELVPRVAFPLQSRPVSEDAVQLLRDARDKAQRLLAGLVAQSEDLSRQPRDVQVDPEKLARGRQAFADAIASTQRTLDAFNEALKST